MSFVKVIWRLLSSIYGESDPNSTSPPTLFKSFQSLLGEFSTEFPNQHEHYTLSLYLQVMIEDLTDAYQRVVLYFYLYHLQSWYTLREIVFTNSTISNYERLFILQLLTNASQEVVLKSNPYLVLHQLTTQQVNQQLENITKNQILMNALTEMKKSHIYDIQINSLRGIRSMGVSRYIYLLPPQTLTSVPSEASSYEASDQEYLLQFEPAFQRPLPEMLPINEDFESHWILPSQNITFERGLTDKDFIWCEQNNRTPTLSKFLTVSGNKTDSTRVDPTTYSSQISTEDDDNESNPADEAKWRKLFSSAFSQQLKPLQQSYVSKHLSDYLSHTSILTPNRLSDLVRNNPQIATQALTHYTLLSVPIDEYLSVLANMQPVCLQSMEVTNALLEANVPDIQIYLRAYIHNAITSCDKLSDASMQKRLVRILCVFLKSLIQRQLLDVQSDIYQDLMVQLKSYCLQFAKIKEAVELMRLIP